MGARAAHAAASMFIEQGVPAKKIQTILGHSSVTMTLPVPAAGRRCIATRVLYKRTAADPA